MDANVNYKKCFNIKIGREFCTTKKNELKFGIVEKILIDEDERQIYELARKMNQ